MLWILKTFLSSAVCYEFEVNMKKKIILGFAAFLMTYCALHLARADSSLIEINGRLENAQCFYEGSNPVYKTCVSESWVCRVTDNQITCETKR